MKKLLGLVPIAFVWLASTLGCSGNAPLDGRPPDRVAAAVDLGRLPPGTLVDFVIGLSPRRPTELHKYVAMRRSGDAMLAPDDFADLYAAKRQDYARVMSWMEQHGIIVTRANAGRTTVSGLGSAGAVESLFGVELHQYSDAGGTFFAASGPITVANELVGVVNGVVGLSGSGNWQSHLAWPDLSAGAVITPDAMHTLYNTMTYANPGMGETVAILGAGLAPDPTADVGTFMSHYKPYGVASAASYSQTFLGGPNRDDVTSAQNEQIENILDAEMVLSMAPLANVVHVLTATNAPGLFTDGISYIVNQLPKAHTVSVSYGGCERGASQEMPVLDTLMEQAQAEGQQWFFASGDSGTDGCRDGSGNKHITAGWPTSSPFVVGVGGTMVGNGGVEIVWNQNTTGVGAGGGAPSEVFPKPAYQMGKTPADNARDTPDVAALAGGGGANIGYQGRIVGPVYGTSVAAPIFAGAWALVDQGKGGGGITDALTKLYAVAGTNAFNDVITGDNGGPDDASAGYLAGPGYDLATGLGTPNVVNLISNLP
ncbi:MAG TPA: S53 family serine peptidase [Polyangia bacterium]|nr:S53 family serine peptidase [Polyangia bacterium]